MPDPVNDWFNAIMMTVNVFISKDFMNRLVFRGPFIVYSYSLISQRKNDCKSVNNILKKLDLLVNRQLMLVTIY